jgi:hypothetical protein
LFVCYACNKFHWYVFVVDLVVVVLVVDLKILLLLLLLNFICSFDPRCTGKAFPSPSIAQNAMDDGWSYADNHNELLFSRAFERFGRTLSEEVPLNQFRAWDASGRVRLLRYLRGHFP